ncbi:MAG: 16S rRNA (guanine(527)-N(7))-methyltransferase RsmG, partial [Nitriliruptorales bacterium]|nr:16S rRNA (guanine(527)-N(7))-methyltransferase RsmG [Nitriliruptorales bacterium]
HGSELPHRGWVDTVNHPNPPVNSPQTANDGVSAGQDDVDHRLQRLAGLIAGSPHNLVSARERDKVFERHVLECNALADQLTPSGTWMDLGTGGGLPGLVLALRYPGIKWTLMDATAKKVAAVRTFVDVLGLTNVAAVQGRAESLAHDAGHRGRYDVVVSRAVAPLASLVELSRGFIGDGGAIVVVKGPHWEAELAGAHRAMERLRVRLIHSVRLEVAARPSWVVTMRAEGPPPVGFPRRDGIPQHDPIV